MAIAAIIKMRCIRLQPAAGGNAEVAELRESSDPDAAKQNIKKHPVSQAQPRADMSLVIDNVAGQAAFKKDQAYVVTFTETT